MSGGDGWTAGAAYERYMGRWSRPVAGRFLDWLGAPEGADWIDVGCGTGALSATILERCAPASVIGYDASDGFVAYASERVSAARFEVADARRLPAADGAADAAVSGLMLNFLPEPAEGLAEMRRAVRPGGTVAFYVWDYPGGGMGLIDAFWRAARALDAEAAALDEGARFPGCTAEGLAGWCRAAGLVEAEVQAIEAESRFEDFAAFWEPFETPVGPAPSYAMGLPAERRDALKERLAADLGDGPIVLPARAWAARARA